MEAESFPYPWFSRMALQWGSEVGVEVEVVEPKAGYLLCLRKQGKKLYLLADVNPLNPHVASRLARDKAYTRMVLEREGVPIPRGEYFFFPKRFQKYDYAQGRSFTEALAFARKLGFPLVLKPNTQSMGKGVTFVRDEGELLPALEQMAATFPQERVFLVEEFLAGREVRLILLDGEVLLALERRPLTIRGNGADTVEILLQKEWQRRQLSPRRFSPLQLAQALPQGVDLATVPFAGEVVILREGAWNLHQGGLASALDMANLPSHWVEVARKCLQVLGLRYGGVDMRLQDDRLWILEVNSNAGFARFATMGHREEELAKAAFLRILEAIFETSEA